MPDLSDRVRAVSLAVDNVTKVGKDTIQRSDDEILRADLPHALQRVDRASKLLEEAAYMFRQDPYSQQARQVLLEGSRGILQGTSALLLCLDESEVRKMVKACKKVINYMEVVEVIEKMQDLVQFVQDLTPALNKVFRDLHTRQRELTHQMHRVILMRCCDNLKEEVRVLISAMKIYVLLLSNGESTAEAVGNRNYHTQRITDELQEIIRVLQLNTYDDDEWDQDSLTCMKRALGAMTSKIQSAHDWLEDPYAPNGGIGEKSLRQILDHAERIASRSLPPDRDAIKKQCGDIRAMADALCELRQNNQSGSPQAQSLARQISLQLKDLLNLCTRAIANMELGGNLRPAHTLSGKMDQAQRWLNNLSFDDHGLGEQAVQAIIDEARHLALACHVQNLRQQMLALCDDAEILNKQLGDMCRRGQANSAQAQSMARDLSGKLRELRRFVKAALVNRVVDDFIDATFTLRKFTETVLTTTTTTTTTNQTSISERDALFNEKARLLSEWSKRASQTARHVATNSAQTKLLSESISSLANQIDSQTPHLINAGRIRYNHTNEASANENFMHMKDQYETTIVKLRNLIDEATDSAAFVRASEDAIRRHTQACEMAISMRQEQSMVDNAASVGRLANRVIMVARQETNNSEDAAFKQRMDQATRRLQDLVPNMVRHAKSVAESISDIRNHGAWRDSNNGVIEAVANIGQALGPSDIGDLLTRTSSFESSHITRITKTTTTTTQQLLNENDGSRYQNCKY